MAPHSRHRMVANSGQTEARCVLIRDRAQIPCMGRFVRVDFDAGAHEAQFSQHLVADFGASDG